MPLILSRVADDGVPGNLTSTPPRVLRSVIWAPPVTAAAEAAAGEGVVIGIGRNTEDSLVSVSAIFDITQADVDNAYSFHNEVGNADVNIIGGDLTANAIQAVFVGELGSLA